MAQISWSSYQVGHIQRRHQVTAEEFDEAWHDPARQDLKKDFHEKHGPCVKSIGCTLEGHVLVMIWRWQKDGDVDSVWPITAHFKGRRKRPKTHRTGRRRP